MKNYILLLLGTALLWNCNSTVSNKQLETSPENNTDTEAWNTVAAESAKTVVINLFDGVRESNKEKISSTLSEDAEFVSAREENGALVEKITSGAEFAEKAGAPHEAMWDERLSDMEVTLEGDRAMLTANYEFYLGETYSHKGEMKVDLQRSEESWLIQRVWYTVVKQ